MGDAPDYEEEEFEGASSFPQAIHATVVPSIVCFFKPVVNDVKIPQAPRVLTLRVMKRNPN